ncbi:MAG: calcium/sodium antiporter [Bacteroidales bacterium]
MITNTLLLILSLAILYFGADWLVKGSSSLALRLGIPSLIVGLTIVAMGTSAPEFLVSLQAALMGEAEIAVGNVVGSNIFNIGVILGIAALVSPLVISKSIIKQDMPILLLFTSLFVFLFRDGSMSRGEALIFVAGAVIYTAWLIFTSIKIKRTDKKEDETIDIPPPSKHWYIDIIYIVGGLVSLAIGARLLVDNAVLIAQALSISDKVIGLTIVAAGTSMPELATSVVASFKGNKDIAIGNVVGSNIYNLLIVMGMSATISPISIENYSSIEGYAMLTFSILLLPLMKTGYELKRWEAILLIVLYVLFIVYLLIQ